MDMTTPTHRLYYTDAGLTTFDARVRACRPTGDHHVVVLDQTAFYPTSGGQPHDLGTMQVLGPDRDPDTSPVSVLDVIDSDDEGVLHVTDGPIEPGTHVRGTIDAARRFDHRQQHTGQHVLSAAFDRLFGARTVGFHLGATNATLDLDKPLGPDAIAAAEAEANRIVWENRPVTIRFATQEEAASLPLRKEPVKTGPLRLVVVEDYDLSACGGTHVSMTGGIGVIVVRSWEKLRGGTRLEFFCGGRALSSYRQLRDAVARSLTRLSVAPEELPEAIERVQGDNKALQRVLRGFQEKLAEHEASALVARGRQEHGVTLVVETVEGWDQSGLKALAAAAAATPGVAAGLLTATEPALVVVARSADVGLDAGAVLRTLVARVGGKGGGKPDLAQGGGLTGAGAALESTLREIMRQAIQPSS